MTDENPSFDNVKHELEIEKLRAELNEIRVPFYKKSTFWTSIVPPICTLGIAIFATILTIKSGIFDVRERELRFDTKLLTEEKRLLSDTITNYKEDIETYKKEKLQALKERDSTIAAAKRTVDFAKKQYAVEKDRKKTQAEFLKDVETLVAELGIEILKYDTMFRSISAVPFYDEAGLQKRNQEHEKISRNHVQQFVDHYQFNAKIIADRLSTMLNELKFPHKRRSEFMYDNPVNPTVIKLIHEDIKTMLTLFKNNVYKKRKSTDN